MAIELLSYTNGTPKINSNKGYPGKSITETIINGFFTVDRKWTVIYWNKAAEKILGIPAKDVIGKNLWEEFAGKLPLEFYNVYYKAFLKNIPVHFEEYWGEMDSWFDVIAYHCDDILSVSFKSSNRSVHPEHLKYPQQQLKIINELYRFVTEVTNDCLWEWDLQTKEMFWIDGGHKRVFGYQIENALIPQSFWESRLHPDDKGRILASLNKIITEGINIVWEDEYRFEKADGNYAYVHDRGHIIFDDDKKAMRMIGATQDITARKVVEIRLLESERKLSLIAKQTTNALIITDEEEKITWVNSAFTWITGYTIEEAIGKKPGGFLQGKETDEATVKYLRKRIKGKQTFDCEIINYNKAGSKYWVHIQGQPILDEKGVSKKYFAIGTDITEKVLSENKLASERQSKQREITGAAIEAHENERLNISNELQENINQVLGATKLYIEMAKEDKKNKKMYLEKSSELVLNVIGEMRRIFKTLASPNTIISLAESIENLLQDLMAINPIKIKLNVKGIEKPLDEKLELHIYRIIQEQLNNILKHANATYASISLTKRLNEIILLISDDGNGYDILKEKKGLGIINIKSRAELYLGKVMIVTKPGKGYELKVVLPLNNS